MENPAAWAMLLFVAFVLMNGIVVLPAIYEWKTRSDARPLKVVREYDGDIRFFARSFATFVEKNFGPMLADCRESGELREGNLADGQAFQIVPIGSSPVIRGDEESNGHVNHIVLAPGSVSLHDDVAFDREIYADGPIIGGRNGIYRALLSRSDITLKEASVVLRWAHADGAFACDDASLLFGRISAERSITLGAGTCFARMQAPVINFGRAAERPMRSFALSPVPPQTLPRVLDGRGGRTLVKGDISIPPFSRVHGSIVATGKVTIGHGAWISGNVKGEQGVSIEPGVWLDGALVSGDNLRIAEESWVKGPIVAERHISVARDCRLGSPDKPTTVSAEAIVVASGSTAYGTVWAREAGRVVTAAESGKH